MTPLLQILIGGLVGALAGLAYFSALWWNVSLFERGAAPRALALLVARFGLLALVFVVLAKSGAIALISGAAGLFLARRIVVRRVGKP